MNRVPQMLNLFLLFTLCNTVEVNATESANQVEYRRHVEKVWLHLIRQDLVLSNFSLAAPDLSNTNEFDTTSENPVQTNGDLFYVPETSKHPWPNSSEVANTLNADDRLVETDDKESYPCAANTCSSFVHRIQSSVVKEFKNVLLDDHLRSTGQKATLYAPHLPYVKPNLTELGEANVSMLEKLFASASLNNIRNHEHNQPLKEKAVKSITGQLSSYALEMYNQEFTFKAPNGSQVTGVNVIAVIPGRRRHQPGDRILLIGAHYDTVKNSVGVDDNGSGVAALIELSRLCSSHIGKFNSTIYFVAFDMQEHGILGSLAFVNQYLIPEEIAGKKAKFTGAYIMDMVMNFDSRPRSQSLPLDIFTVTKRSTR